MLRRIALCVACFGLAACATPAPDAAVAPSNAERLAMSAQPVAAEAVLVDGSVPDAAKEAGLVDEDTLICRKERRVGTHIPEMVCVSAAERDKLRNISREYLDATKRTAGATPQNQ